LKAGQLQTISSKTETVKSHSRDAALGAMRLLRIDKENEAEKYEKEEKGKAKAKAKFSMPLAMQ